MKIYTTVNRNLSDTLVFYNQQNSVETIDMEARVEHTSLFFLKMNMPEKRD